MTLMRSVVLYDSETWPLRKIEEIIECFRKKYPPRTIFEPYEDDQTGKWRRKHNQKL